MALKFINEVDLKGKNILGRFDFNVPLENGVITDTTRLDLALPTIRYMIEQGASRIVLMSHLGRPKDKFDTKYSLAPVATYLAEQLRRDVILTPWAVHSDMKAFIKLPDSKFILLENLRFHPEEEKNDAEFAKKLSEYGEIYVNDAFGAAHRKHASIYGIVHYFKDRAVGGFLLKKEIEALSKVVSNQKRPFAALIGGAKIADKIKTIDRLLVSVDTLLMGGAMAYPFLAAKGVAIGKSLCSETDLELAHKILRQNTAHKIVLPIDHVVAKEFNGQPESCPLPDIPGDRMGMDIGPKTCALFAEKLKGMQTVFWNGPMGLFENEHFAAGTMKMAQVIAEIKGFTIVGGGDSVSAVNKSGLQDKFYHVSTGGGASLEYIEQGQLPGIQALKFGV